MLKTFLEFQTRSKNYGVNINLWDQAVVYGNASRIVVERPMAVEIVAQGLDETKALISSLRFAALALEKPLLAGGLDCTSLPVEVEENNRQFAICSD